MFNVETQKQRHVYSASSALAGAHFGVEQILTFGARRSPHAHGY
jgi:hypothetical protein